MTTKITSNEIAANSITATLLSATAITDKLGYTPADANNVTTASISSNDTSIVINDTGTNSNVVLTVDGTKALIFTGTALLPYANVTYDLGSLTKQWKDVYVGPGSLYVNGQKVLQESAGTIIVSADPDQNIRVAPSGDGNIELDPTGTGSILLQGPIQVQTGQNISSSDGNPIIFGNAIAVDAISTKSPNTNLVVTANGTGVVCVNDDLTVSGNLSVQGTVANLSVNTLSIKDNIIDVSSQTTGTPTSNAGIRVVRGDQSATQLIWNETALKWQFTNDGNAYKDIADQSTVTSSATYANTALNNAASASLYANSGITLAQSAYNQGNSTATVANTAVNNAASASQYANTGINNAASASSYANTGINNAASASTYANTGINNAASASAYANAGITLAQSAYNQGNSTATIANTKFDTAGGTITGNVTIANNKDLTVTGNLYIQGNTVSVNTASFTVQDSLILLATGNYTTDAKDIGFAGHYNAGSNAHTGVVRDSGTKEWYVFDNYTPELDTSNNLDINDASFRTANVNAQTFKGNLIGTTVVVNGVNLGTHVQSAFNQANTGVNNAASASSYANTGINNAASASLYANTGINNAASASLYANTAINNVASASLYANTGINNAASASLYANNALSYLSSNVSYLQGIENTQNTNITTATNNAASASLYANTGINNAASASAYANTAINNAASASSYANTAINNAASASAYANTDYTTISVTAATYGNTTYVPVITLAANGRISAITNTAITSSGGSLSLSDDTSTNATYYPMIATGTGTATSGKISTTKLTFNPSTGTLTATALTESSSVRFKENIEPIGNTLDKVLQLTGVTYDLKDKSNTKKQVGLIAEDVLPFIPEVVDYDEQGNISGINYSRLTVHLIESIKELKAEIDLLKGK